MNQVIRLSADGVDVRYRVACHTHLLKFIQCDDGWSCKGTKMTGACKNGCTGFHQTYGWRRFQCIESCGFDLCEGCLKAYIISYSIHNEDGDTYGEIATKRSSEINNTAVDNDIIRISVIDDNNISLNDNIHDANVVVASQPITNSSPTSETITRIEPAPGNSIPKNASKGPSKKTTKKKVCPRNPTIDELEAELTQLQMKLLRYQAHESIVEKYTLTELTSLETELQRTLNMIERQKATVLQRKTESNVCVTCRENEKSVVLMPCRHLCLCSKCSDSRKVNKCPVCTSYINKRIKIFA